MDQSSRELLVARMVAGCIRWSTVDRFGKPCRLLIKSPTREQRYMAQELYQDVLNDGILNGLYSDAELVDFLVVEGFWDENQEKLLQNLPKEIEEFKVRLYKEMFKSNERATIRKALGIAKAKLEEVTQQRNAYGHLSCSGSAAIARNRYLLGCSLYYADGRPVFTDESFWEECSDLLDLAVTFINRSRVDEPGIRELARTEPWRSIWSCRKADAGVFGKSPCDYTDEQSRLIGYTVLYDSIFEHPECPDDSIIGDDDMLDGWMIDQRRQRQARQGRKQGEEVVGNEKIRNSQEVYLMADTAEDAGKIDAMNDAVSAAIKRQRLAALDKAGTLNEIDMPDTRLRLRTELAQRLGKGG